MGFVYSKKLGREVQVDIYLPELPPETLLLVNDGQDLPLLDIPTLLKATPVMVAGIHAGSARRQEYGVAGIPDFQGDGSLAAEYTAFILEELLPWLYQQHPAVAGLPRGFAGFSLGGLSALDIVWRHPDIFTFAGVCSGALWWRDKPLDAHYSDLTDRIMHRVIRKGHFHPGMQFFFECGTDDETADRNNNGVIDSIDDTLDLIEELQMHGYQLQQDIHYLEIQGGRHHPDTWKLAVEAMLRLPFFSERK
ncbi:alpha/beta hydrolase [Chitinophaga vietnamensis]|uniref:alpha/beta hydrolase n=1 Tax=Chitinophaga vietnamensis TaxID=2593957 RepID=UPI00117856FD|nr:alpha/beta hydrolase-fold protein [Chitinophaga vietnamensis]